MRALRAARERLTAEGRAIALAHGVRPEDAPRRPGSAAQTSGAAQHKPSMLQDYELGRPMEVEAMLAMPCAFARAAGVEAPALEQLAAVTARLAARKGLYSRAMIGDNAKGRLVDLRSDTVTRPSAGMRRAMMEAPLGDDVFGDDPTVNRLQAHAAQMLGFAHALLFPSGTQSNLAALMSHCGRGDEVHRRPGGAHLPLRGGRRRGARLRSSRSRSPTGPTARSTLPRSRPRSSPTTRISRARACWRWKIRSAERRLREPILRMRWQLAKKKKPGHPSRRRAHLQCRGRRSG